ncbi:MAG: nucleotide exchange factor GrpE [Anaerolineae bacterium]|nr:nucleotide exchange factor GrpE [Anaerolineae bacterium]
MSDRERDDTEQIAEETERVEETASRAGAEEAASQAEEPPSAGGDQQDEVEPSEAAEEVQTPQAVEEAEEAATEGEAPPEESPEECIATLEAELAEAKAQADHYLDQWRRTAAEFANYRKRREREQAEFVQQANAALISKLLPVLDDFDLAFEHLPEDVASSTWVEGFALIRRKLQAILEQEGVSVIEAVGKPFDPELHEAVTHEESDEVESGHVIAEVRKGYRLGDKVLRPAMVRVAR